MTISTLRRGLPAAAVLSMSLVLAACGSKTTAATGGATTAASGAAGSATKLVGAGSSAQQAAMQAWIAGYQTAHSGVTVDYDPVGSGGGRDQFLGGGKVSFAGSDGALSADEHTKAQTRCGAEGAIDIPVYLSAIAVIYKLDGVTNLQLSADTVAKIFDQKITTWNDAAIAADNPGVKLPATKVTPVNRSDKSGTTKNFTDFLAKAATSNWSYGPVDVWPVKGGEQAEGTSGVVSTVSQSNGTIGYADLSQAKGLGVASIKVGTAYVQPSAEAAAKVLEESKKAATATGNDLSYSINRTPTGSGVYPIVLLSYHIVCQHYTDAATGKLVKDFESYVTSADGQAAAAKQAGSSPLSATVLATVKASVDSIKAG